MQQKRQSFAHTHRQSLFACPRSQTAPVCRGAGWPPASLAFLTVDMCITQFIFQH